MAQLVTPAWIVANGREYFNRNLKFHRIFQAALLIENETFSQDFEKFYCLESPTGLCHAAISTSTF